MRKSFENASITHDGEPAFRKNIGESNMHIDDSGIVFSLNLRADQRRLSLSTDGATEP